MIDHGSVAEDTGHNGRWISYPLSFANDALGGVNGTLMGGTTYASGVSGLAFSFDGTSGYVELGTPANLQFTNAMTMSAWVRPTAFGSQQIILNYEDSYEVALNNGRLQYALNCCGGNNDYWKWVDTGITAALNQWTGFAISYTSGQVKIYDGSGNLVNTFTDAPPYIDPPVLPGENLRIGARPENRSTIPFSGATSYFAGQIDEVHLYNSAIVGMPITPVPEPETYALMLAGLGLVGFAARRRG